MTAILEPAVVDRLRQARHLVVFTGAGMSAESGIPTFRDRRTGLWAHTDPSEVATPQAFRRDPQRVWDWHVHIAAAISVARPNAGHRAIAGLAARLAQVSVITQNIDSLHQAAGTTNVIELHGNLFRLKSFVDEEGMIAAAQSPLICRVCDGYAAQTELDPWASRDDLAAIRLEAGPVPRCPCCGAYLRPDIVWFNEMLDPLVVDAAIRAVDACDVLLCVGSSLLVEPAASLPWRALRRGALVIEINPQPTDLARLVPALCGTAARVLPELVETVWA